MVTRAPCWSSGRIGLRLGILALGDEHYLPFISVDGDNDRQNLRGSVSRRPNVPRLGSLKRRFEEPILHRPTRLAERHVHPPSEGGGRASRCGGLRPSLTAERPLAPGKAGRTEAWSLIRSNIGTRRSPRPATNAVTAPTRFSRKACFIPGLPPAPSRLDPTFHPRVVAAFRRSLAGLLSQICTRPGRTFPIAPCCTSQEHGPD